VLVPFGELLYCELKERGITLSAFARTVAYPQPNFSLIRKGVRPVPVDRVKGWADALGLAGPQREHFLDMAALTHAPERIRILVTQLQVNWSMDLRVLASAPKRKKASILRS